MCATKVWSIVGYGLIPIEGRDGTAYRAIGLPRAAPTPETSRSAHLQSLEVVDRKVGEKDAHESLLFRKSE